MTKYRGVSKSSRTVLVKRSLLTLDVKFLHHLQSTSLLHEYSGPSVSAMLGSIPGSPFLEMCQVPAAIRLESLQWCRIFDPSSEASAWGRGKITTSPRFATVCFATIQSDVGFETGQKYKKTYETFKCANINTDFDF